MKKLISVLLTVCIALSVLSVGVVFASAAEGVIAGTNVKWSYDDSANVLTFSGEGSIPDYDDYLNSLNLPSLKYPWKDCAYTSIVFGDEITGIGNYAFCYSPHLESVTVPENISVMGKGVFLNCKELTTAEINAQVFTLGDSTFAGCSSLTDVTLPANLKTIGYRAFYNCTALKGLDVPSSVTKVSEDAFYQCSALEKITLDGVMTIEKHAFYACEKMEEITFGKELKTIGENAFDDCRVLKSVSFPEGFNSMSAAAFSGCKALDSVTLPSTLQKIPDEAFNLCTALKGITIDPKVTAIGKKAFGYGRLGIKIDGFTVTGYSNTYAEKYAKDNGFTFVSLGDYYSGKCGENAEWKFDKATGLLSITGSGAIENCTAENLPVYTQRFKGEIKNISVSGEITAIGDYAFYGVTPAELSVSGAVETIGEKAIGNFDGTGTAAPCTLAVHYGSAAHEYAKDNGMTVKYLSPNGTVGENITWVFDEKDTLYIFGEGELGGEYTLETLPAYSSIEGIKKVVVSEGITGVSANAFTFCRPIESITFGSKIENLGEKAFGFVKTAVLGEDGTETGEFELSANENLTVYGYDNTPVKKYAFDNSFVYISLGGEDPEPPTPPVFPELVIPGEYTSFIDEEAKTVYFYNTDVASAEFYEKLAKDGFTSVTVTEGLIGTGSVITLEANGETKEYTFIVMGDVNGDGKVNSSDALAILQHSVGSKTLEGNALVTADLSGDGMINSADALACLQIAVGQYELKDFMKEEEKEDGEEEKTEEEEPVSEDIPS